MKQVTFATAFYHANGKSPNINSNESDEKKFAKYYKCMVVMFSSIRRFYQNEQAYIFTDRKISEEYSARLEKLNVKTIILDTTNIKFTNSNIMLNNFPGCLFTLDVLLNIDTINERNTILCLLDSDIVMLNEFDRLVYQTIKSEGYSAYELNYPIEKFTNGQSRDTLNKISNDFYQTQKNCQQFKYFGGEFILISNKILFELKNDIPKLINYISRNYPEALEMTEEHILSIILNQKTGYQCAHKVIKRVWTTDTHCNADGKESSLCLLHMPSEKNKFFLKTYKQLIDHEGLLAGLTKSDYTAYMIDPIEKRLHVSLTKKIIIFIKIALVYMMKAVR